LTAVAVLSFVHYLQVQQWLGHTDWTWTGYL